MTCFEGVCSYSENPNSQKNSFGENKVCTKAARKYPNILGSLVKEKCTFDLGKVWLSPSRRKKTERL